MFVGTKNGEEEEVRPGPAALKLKFKFSKTSHLTPGSMVEVTSDLPGYQGSWYVAKILNTDNNNNILLNTTTATSTTSSTSTLLVEYQHLFSDDDDSSTLHTEETSLRNIRPSPPTIPIPSSFRLNQQVDAWFNDGWWSGSISRLLPTNPYTYVVFFSFTNEHLEFLHSNLRPHQDWIDGIWVLPHLPPIEEHQHLTAAVPVPPPFAKGTRVEVKSDVEGFEGSLFAATIVDFIGTDKFLVEYETLRSDDDTQPLKEEALASFVRPYPPDIIHPKARAAGYNRFDKVDAWYNDGWWVGVVSKLLPDMKYSVYFAASKEVLELDHSTLRPHQEWIDGKWCLASSQQQDEKE